MGAVMSVQAAAHFAQVGRYAVIVGPDHRASLIHRLAWCAVEAYCPEQDLFTVRTLEGALLQVCPCCLQVASEVAAHPQALLQVVS